MYLIPKSISYRYVYTAFLTLFVIFSGSFAIIGNLRFIEAAVPIIGFVLIVMNRNVVPFGITSKLFLIFIFLILSLGLLQFNNNSLFAIRLANSLITCLVIFYVSSNKLYFNLYPRLLFCLTLFLYVLGIYGYFWEYTYIFSILFVPLVFLKKYIFAAFNVSSLLLIGQRTSILNIGYVLYRIFFTGKLNIVKIFSVFIIFFGILLIFTYFDLRALNAYKEIDLGAIYHLLSSAIEVAGYYSYDEFVYGDRNEVFVEGGDVSLQRRFRKWGHALAHSDFNSLFLGLGPGYFGKGADSGWIRLFFEFGLIVFTFFAFLVYKIYKNSNQIQKLVIGVFIISNVFLDILYSPLLMGFTGMLLGLSRGSNENVNR